MCKICVKAENLPIKVNGTKVYLPKNTRIGLIKSLSQSKSKASKIYHKELLSGDSAFVDCFGGITISKINWEQMVKDLNLTLVNENKHEFINNFPAFADC
jgi:hypothetical protein